MRVFWGRRLGSDSDAEAGIRQGWQLLPSRSPKATHTGLCDRAGLGFGFSKQENFETADTVSETPQELRQKGVPNSVFQRKLGQKSHHLTCSEAHCFSTQLDD